MVKHMNILVIPTWYPSGKDKLMGNYHKEFCEALAMSNNIRVNMLFIERERLNNPLKFLFMPKHKNISEKNYHVYITRMLNRERLNYKWQIRYSQSFRYQLQGRHTGNIRHDRRQCVA